VRYSVWVMLRMAPLPRSFALVLALLCSTSTTSTAGPAEDLRTLVGGRQARLVVVDRAASGKILLLDTARGGSPTVLVDEIGCDAPLLAPAGKQLVYNRGGAVHVQTLSGGTSKQVAAGSNGHWYVDAAGEAWVVYTTNLKPVKVTWPDGKGIETRRVRLRDGKVEPLASWKASGGVSPDGRFAAGVYASLVRRCCEFGSDWVRGSGGGLCRRWPSGRVAPWDAMAARACGLAI
jgi:hypothetical protein